MYDWLLASGLDIVHCNRVRRTLSQIKGGRLAALLFPRRVWVLAISDVPGDDPAVIGSGPLARDTAGADLPVDGLPPFIRKLLQHAPPPPAPGVFAGVETHIVATLAMAKRAAAQAARAAGYAVAEHAGFVAGDAVATGRRLAQAVRDADPGCVQVWGGETTVHLPRHPGRGGRNQSLALAAALELRGQPSAWLLAAGSDGSDGPGDDAGALVDGGSVQRAALHGFDASACLTRADAGSALAASGDLLSTGPTGTNVMDIMLGLRT
jgi:hydroxypyruvate reductase